MRAGWVRKHCRTWPVRGLRWHPFTSSLSTEPYGNVNALSADGVQVLIKAVVIATRATRLILPMSLLRVY